MARPKKAAAQATQALATTPNYSAFGIGTGFDAWASLLPELSTTALIKEMFVMAETDETVGAMLYCIDATMRQIDWAHEPWSGGKRAPDDVQAKKYADLMNGMLIDMDRPFGAHVEDALTMLWAGFAPAEIILKRRDGLNSLYGDGFYGIDTLNLIDQTTVWDWMYEDHRLVALKQMGASILGSPGEARDGIIPLNKVVHYRTAQKYNNPWGRPLLKSAWRVWKLKRKVQDSEAVGVERELCGLPVFRMPQEVIDAQFEVDGSNQPTKDALRAQAMVRAAQQAVRDLRFNKSGGLVMPSNTYSDDEPSDHTVRYDFKILTSGGQRAIDARTVARDHDHAIARVAMMQFLTLGQRSGGSYGLSEDQSSMAVNSIMAICDKIVDEWNQKLVRYVFQVNGWPLQYMPRLAYTKVNKNNLGQLGQFLAGVGRIVDLWGNDSRMRVAIAKTAGFDYDLDAQEQAATTHQETADQEAQPPPAPVVHPPGAMPAPGNAPPKTKTPIAANKEARAPDEEEDEGHG